LTANEAEEIIEFALHVQDRRVARHMTQEELAVRVGLSRPQIANIEAGRGGTSAYRALCIAQALGVTVEYLFGLRDGEAVRR